MIRQTVQQLQSHAAYANWVVAAVFAMPLGTLCPPVYTTLVQIELQLGPY
jgi:hypothetical protein